MFIDYCNIPKPGLAGLAMTYRYLPSHDTMMAWPWGHGLVGGGGCCLNIAVGKQTAIFRHKLLYMNVVFDMVLQHFHCRSQCRTYIRTYDYDCSRCNNPTIDALLLLVFKFKGSCVRRFFNPKVRKLEKKCSRVRTKRFCSSKVQNSEIIK